MRIGTRFSIAVHVLALLGQEHAARGAASESRSLAGSIGVNPVVVRSVMGQLRRAGLVKTSQGVAGATLVKPIDEIALLDVYRAVEADADLFAIHERPNPVCPIGAGIQATLECVLGQAQRALEERLETITLKDVLTQIKQRSAMQVTH